MKRNSMEKEMEEWIVSEVESLKIQVKLLENELELARLRAETCEEELRHLKAFLVKTNEIEEDKCQLPPPPPPLPPAPKVFKSLLKSEQSKSNTNIQTQVDALVETNAVNQKATGRIIDMYIFEKAYLVRYNPTILLTDKINF